MLGLETGLVPHDVEVYRMSSPGEGAEGGGQEQWLPEVKRGTHSLGTGPCSGHCCCFLSLCLGPSSRVLRGTDR